MPCQPLRALRKPQRPAPAPRPAPPRTGGQHVAAHGLHLPHQPQVGAVLGGLEGHVLQQVGRACTAACKAGGRAGQP